jgi:hypothetical protein
MPGALALIAARFEEELIQERRHSRQVAGPVNAAALNDKGYATAKVPKRLNELHS